MLAEQVKGHIMLVHVTEKSESGEPAELKQQVGAYRNSNIEIKTASVAEQITLMVKEHDLLIMRASERPRGQV